LAEEEVYKQWLLLTTKNLILELIYIEMVIINNKTFNSKPIFLTKLVLLNLRLQKNLNSEIIKV